MLNPQMKGWNMFEIARQDHEQLQAEREAVASKPAKPIYARGSMEYAAQQEAILRGSSGDG
jgi:hypothetical protein